MTSENHEWARNLTGTPDGIFRTTNGNADEMAVDSRNGDCYIVPVEDLSKWGNTKKLSAMQEYKENWDLFVKIANEKVKNN